MGKKNHLLSHEIHSNDSPRLLSTNSSIQFHRKKSDVPSSHTTYQLTTHSHDLVDMDLIDVLVDEDGIVDSDRLWAFAG
jgi:hypothetical protein